MKQKIFVNGTFLSPSEAKISTLETGFLFGYGLFETMRSYEGFIFKLSEHIERLTLSAQFFKIPLPFSKKDIAKMVQKTLIVNNLNNAYIKIILSGGEYTGELSKPSQKSNLIIIAKPFTSYPDIYYTQGVSATFSTIRRNPSSPIYTHKTLNFLENLLAKREAEEKKFQEALFLNTKGYLAEGCTTNIFLIKKEKVITPSLDSGILPGITREVVLNLCRLLGLSHEERKVKLEELYKAEEAFLTNSLREILPLTRIDSHIIGRKGKVGEITRTLMEEYKKLTKS